MENWFLNFCRRVWAVERHEMAAGKEIRNVGCEEHSSPGFLLQLSR
jgi:hypothetical protein